MKTILVIEDASRREKPRREEMAQGLVERRRGYKLLACVKVVPSYGNW